MCYLCRRWRKKVSPETWDNIASSKRLLFNFILKYPSFKKKILVNFLKGYYQLKAIMFTGHLNGCLIFLSLFNILFFFLHEIRARSTSERAKTHHIITSPPP
jgi:hypothetical protein